MMLKKMLAILLAVLLCMSSMPLLPMNTKAEANINYCGAEGNEENVTWNFDSDTKTLTISGTGKMMTQQSDYPWGNLQSATKKIVVENGITNVGSSSFAGFSAEEVVLGDTIEIIEPDAFYTSKIKKVVIPGSVERIDVRAFRECWELECVVLCEGVKRLEEDAFEDISYYPESCSIYLPSTIEGMHGKAFEGRWTDRLVIYGKNDVAKNYFQYLPFKYVDATIDIDFSKATIAIAQTESDEYEYTGEEIIPLSNITYTGEETKNNEVPLIENVDYKVECENNIEPGTATMTVTGIGCYSGLKTYTYSIYKPMESCDIVLEYDSVLYDGTEKKPNVVVKYNNDTLVENEDYELVYENNTDEGNATVTVIGKGGVKGTVTKTFDIYKKLIESGNIELEYESVLYDGTEKKPNVVVKYGEETLVENTDYEITYKNNTDEGAATVTIVGKGSVKGTVSKFFIIYKTSVEDVTGSFCGGEGNETNVRWNFDAETKTLTINGSGKMMTEPSIYPWNNLKSSIKKVVIGEGVTNVGVDAFQGSTVEEVVLSDTVEEIERAAFHSSRLKSVVIPGSVKLVGPYSFAYCYDMEYVVLNEGVQTIDGGAFESLMKGSVYLPNSIESIESSAFKSDYQENLCVYVKNDVEKQFFKNLAATCVDASSIDFSKVDIKYTQTESNEYIFTGKEIPLIESVTYAGEETNSKVISLVENADYRIECENTIQPGTATMTVTGIGCYSGSKTYTYTIYKPMESCNVTIETSQYLYDGTKKTPKVNVTFEGKALVANQDYEVVYNNNIEEGLAEVIVNGKGSYKGSIMKYFSIYKNDVTELVVTPSYETVLYDGTEKKPTVTVKTKDGVVVKDNQYDVSYQDNVMPGDASIIVTGKYQYKGSTRVTFDIEALTIENADVTLKESIYSYDGSAKTPGVTVKLGDKVLVKDKDYKVSYEDNVNDGTANAVVIGCGIYKDVIKVSFVILPYNAGMDAVYPDGTLIDGNFVYGITDDETNEVELCCPATQKLSKVQIPATIKDENGIEYSVTSIGTKAFYKNTKITSLVIGNNVKSIENYAFYGCKNMKTVSFGKNVEIIGASAFRKCTKLTSVTLPKSLDELGKNAFYGCSKLKKITINANSVVDVSANAIKGISKKAVIKVPKNLLKKYKKELGKGTGFKSSMKIKKK